MTISLRPAVETDGPAIAALFVAHLRAHGYAPNAELDADMHDVLAAYAPPACFLVAVSRGELIAMAGIKSGEIRRVFVREDHRRGGLGRTLVERLIEDARARGEPRIWAVVNEANAPARTMFAKLGFSEGERKSAYAIFERALESA